MLRAPRRATGAVFRRSLALVSSLLISLPGLLAPELALAGEDRRQFVQFLPEQGLSQSQVTCLLQDSKGYLWVGTRSGGLNRFDGYGFTAFRRDDGLTVAHVRALIEHENHLYVGTRQGLFRQEKGRFVEIAVEGGIVLDVYSLATAADGALLVATQKGLYELKSGSSTSSDGVPAKVVPSPYQASLPDGSIWELAQKEDGTLYLMGKEWLRSLKIPTKGSRERGASGPAKDGATSATAPASAPSSPPAPPFVSIPLEEDLSLTTLHLTRDGTLWVGSKRGLYRLEGDVLIPQSDAHPHLALPVLSLFADRAGRLYVSNRKGVVVLHPSKEGRSRRAKVFNESTGLSSSAIHAITEDNEGNLFLGSDGQGLYQLPPQPFRAFIEGKLEDYAPSSTLIDKRGRRWIGTLGQGLWVIEQDQATPVGEAEGLSSADCTSLLSIDANTLWIGTAAGLFEAKIDVTPVQVKQLWAVGNKAVIDLYADATRRYVAGEAGLWTFENDRWGVTEAPQIPTNALYDLHPAPDNKLWVGTQDSGAFLWDPATRTVSQHLTLEQGLPASFVLSLFVDAEGALLLGTEQGLAEYRDGRLSVFTAKDGLPDDTITFVTASPEDGALWVGTNRGLATRFNGRWRSYTRRQGLPGDETNTGTAWWDARGRLWAGTVHGYAVLENYPPKLNPVPPQVHIEEIRQHEEQLPLDESPTFAYYQNELRFRFVGLSMTDPARIRYRYRLAGLEDQWTETASREVRYPALPPGEFSFEVLASNNDGLWTETPARYHFSIRQPFWETWWFRLGQVALVFFAGIGVYGLRARRIRKLNERLELQVQERTAELQDEKEKSERLLLNILPAPIASELREHGVATTRLYDDVTILFTDFQDFTRTCATISPEQLVDELNEVFAAFDDICKSRRLEKLKTIGDAFMAAGGLPTPSLHHPVDAVEAAIEMQEYLAERNLMEGKTPFKLRIGIHTGPVVAGVIGKWKFAYDIWGDAVNIAARMESSGLAGEINISRNTHERVKHVFQCEARGQVLAKGKGALEMFFVRRRQAGGGDHRRDGIT